MLKSITNKIPNIIAPIKTLELIEPLRKKKKDEKPYNPLFQPIIPNL